MFFTYLSELFGLTCSICRQKGFVIQSISVKFDMFLKSVFECEIKSDALNKNKLE